MYSTSETSRASEASCASDAVLKLLHYKDIWCINPLDNQLRNAITFFDCKVVVAKVEEDDFHLATVVGINYTGTYVDAVLRCETRSWGNSAIYNERYNQPTHRL